MERFLMLLYHETEFLLTVQIFIFYNSVFDEFYMVSLITWSLLKTSHSVILNKRFLCGLFFTTSIFKKSIQLWYYTYICTTNQLNTMLTIIAEFVHFYQIL